MRIFSLIITTTATIALVYALNKPWGATPAMGMLLSPQHGLWQNADNVNETFNNTIKLPNLKAEAQVVIDDKLVPHIFANNDADAYYIQGYLHAKFRLWQMDFQTRAASGRLSEVLGRGASNAVLNFDREQLRGGMKFGAENSLQKMEADAPTKQAMDNYTNGVNAYVAQLSAAQYPIEFKLLGYKPEPWTNLKSALFLKYMAKDLAGFEEDFEYANARNIFSVEQIKKLFPLGQAVLDPIVPNNQITQSAFLKKPPTADSVVGFANNITRNMPNKDNGSNNWAVNGSKTKSGRPILCNDPHLGLNVPAIWYEMQIHTPTHNAYGATFPGAPCVIIGFNDSCAWGFTNAMRDVKDYYEIKFKDATKQQYLFNNQWQNITQTKIETYNLKGGEVFYDTVTYTPFGPVMYDNNFGDKLADNKNYAVRWKAHDASNEIKIFYNLNRAKNFADYKAALPYLETPGQNVIFATKTNDIGITCQGSFPAKWQGQGNTVMPGYDSTYMWQGLIPQAENPYQYNPARGFVSSANQYPVDPYKYPYYLGGLYPPYRGAYINRLLTAGSNFTAQNMVAMQNNNYNIFAEQALPILLKYTNKSMLNTEAEKAFNTVTQWKYIADANSAGAAIFDIWWNKVHRKLVDDDRAKTTLKLPQMVESTLLEAIIKDSSWEFIDDITTPQKETLTQQITTALNDASIKISELQNNNSLTLGQYKNTYAQHLLRLVPFNITSIQNGGGDHILNASKGVHGPSWRMVVHLTDTIEAYGVYPGGQSGNPGSKYYNTFATTWRNGETYPLLFMHSPTQKSDRIKWTMNFKKA